MNEIIIVSIDKMADIRKSAGQTEKRIKNSAQEFISIPESGTFSHIGIKEFDIPNVGLRKSVGLYLTDGGFVSENALNAQKLLNELTEIKNGERKGKFILKSERLTDLASFGYSADSRLVALQGKSFKTAPVPDCRVYKSENLEKFDTVVFEKSNAETLKKALNCTETKKLYIFTIE